MGTDAQRQRWLADLASGATIAACAIAGWADGASAIAAAPEGDGWRLDGSQHAIINGNVASLLLLVVDLGDAGEAAFAIPASTVGVSRRASGARLGARSADVADVKLEAARTDPDDRIGAADSVATLRARARILSGAVSTGVATAAVAAAQHYAGERHQFGQPIGRFQAVQNRIADAATELDAARLLVYRAAQTCASGRPCAGEAAMAAAFAGAAAVSATDHSLQIHGGMGFTDEVSAGRCYRDAITCAHLAGGRRSHSLEIARAMLATGG